MLLGARWNLRFSGSSISSESAPAMQHAGKPLRTRSMTTQYERSCSPPRHRPSSFPAALLVRNPTTAAISLVASSDR